VTVSIVRAPETRARLVGLGAVPVGNGPDEFRTFLREDFERNGRIVKQAGVKIE
jgi:tripartite-type tricarboxylate transporter receptor subunit TctC